MRFRFATVEQVMKANETAKPVWFAHPPSADDFALPSHARSKPGCGWNRSRWRIARWQTKHRFGISAVSHSALTLSGRDSMHLEPASSKPVRFDFDALSFRPLSLGEQRKWSSKILTTVLLDLKIWRKSRSRDAKKVTMSALEVSRKCFPE